MSSQTDLQPDLGRPVLWAGAALVGVGVLASVLIGALAPGGPYWSTGVMLTIYMLGAAAIAGFLGNPARQQPARGQVICDKPAGSQEHVFPDWLIKYLNPTNARTQMQLPNGKVVWARDLTTGLVCHQCNTVWLERKFEGKVAPLIKGMDAGTQPVLYPRHQRLLAAWAWKTLLVVESCGTDGPNIKDKEYKRFRSSGEPPASRAPAAAEPAV